MNVPSPATVQLSCPAGCGVPVSIPYTLGAPMSGSDGTLHAAVQVDWEAVGPDIEAHCLADPAAHPEQFAPEDDTSSPDTGSAYFLDLIARIGDLTEPESGSADEPR